MWFLGRNFLVFIAALVLLFASVFVSYRCGYGNGLNDAPRHYYSVDVARALRDNPEFKSYVNTVYRAAYVQVMDSVLRTEPIVGVVADWLMKHPGCQIKSEKPLKLEKKEVEGVFFKAGGR